MTDSNILKVFKKKLPASQIKINEPLAPHTTLQIGGPADILFIAKTEKELTTAIKLAQQNQINWVILGWGSNVLISDNGFRGIVIKNMSQNIKILGPAPKNIPHYTKPSEPDRHDYAIIKGKKYAVEFDYLNYDETHLPTELIKVSSGENLGKLITWTLDHGLTGLQWFNRIPGTIGGAVHNNIHGGAHYFEEYIHEIQILTPTGKIVKLTKAQLGLGYDKTRFHKTKEIILNITLKLYKGDTEKAKRTALEWAKQKSVQPRNSAGCTFKNITQKDRKKLKYPTTSVGYIIEWILKWSNKSIGNARISTKHHNFIVNDGQASANDVLQLIKQIIFETKNKTGLTLEPEIFFIGFTDQELKGITH